VLEILYFVNRIYTPAFISSQQHDTVKSSSCVTHWVLRQNQGSSPHTFDLLPSDINLFPALNEQLTGIVQYSSDVQMVPHNYCPM